MTYKLKDLAGDDIKGTFYSDEFHIVTKPDDALFDIERFDETMNARRRFHLTLPSNASMYCYPNNTVAQYSTKLPRSVDLEGDWEVSLSEISVPVDFHNVSENQCHLKVTTTRNMIETLYVPAGYYETIGKLLSVLNQLARDMNITFSKYRKKVKMRNEGEYAVMFNEALGRILGFEDMLAYYPGKTYLTKYDVQLRVKTVETLFVYCGVLEHVMVGDVMAPLLRTVDMKHATENGRMHKILNLPLYMPLQKKKFDTIETNIMCYTGNAVPFGHRKSVAVLESKRVGLLEKVIQRTVRCNVHHSQS